MGMGLEPYSAEAQYAMGLHEDSVSTTFRITQLLQALSHIETPFSYTDSL